MHLPCLSSHVSQSSTAGPVSASSAQGSKQPCTLPALLPDHDPPTRHIDRPFRRHLKGGGAPGAAAGPRPSATKGSGSSASHACRCANNSAASLAQSAGARLLSSLPVPRSFVSWLR